MDSPGILTRVASQEPEAFRELVSRYTGLVRSICRRGTWSREDAQDIEQEVFLQLWRKADRYDARGKEASYVAAVTRSLLCDFYKASKRLKRGGGRKREVLYDVHPAKAEPAKTDRRLLLIAEAVPPTELRALKLRLGHGLTYSRIAARLGTTRKEAIASVRRAADLARKAVRA